MQKVSASPTPSVDCETPESPFSRDSPASMSDSSGTSSTSRCSSSKSYSTSSQSAGNPCQQQTVTTKVTATAKLKVEVHAPYIDRDYSSCSSTNRSRYKDTSKRNGR